MGRTLLMCFILDFRGMVGWDWDCIFHRGCWPRRCGFFFKKLHLLIILTFSYKHKSVCHCNPCRSSVKWYQEAGNPRYDGGRWVLPDQSSCNSFCHRKVAKQKNPQGSNHFLQAKQHWLDTDNKKHLISNYTCIRK